MARGDITTYAGVLNNSSIAFVPAAGVKWQIVSILTGESNHAGANPSNNMRFTLLQSGGYVSLGRASYPRIGAGSTDTIMGNSPRGGTIITNPARLTLRAYTTNDQAYRVTFMEI